MTARPDLMPVVLLEEWNFEEKCLEHKIQKTERAELSLDRVKKGFASLIAECSRSIKLCLFIDGLDEFNGDHFEIAKLFSTVASVPNVKVCFSSRPLPVFVEAFQTAPSLKLQYLTFEDIKLFVGDRLGKDKRLQRLSLEEPDRAPALVIEIVNKADGVFLWVKLVV
jgi:hypothetical protein